jgi:hypothetical protein
MADEPKAVTIGDGAITYERPEYDAETKALLAAIETGLAEFGRHKDALLAILRDGYERGLKSAPVDADGTKPRPFDTDRAWLSLESLARHYFHREWVKPRVTKPADRQARLRDIAKALERARDMISEATQSDVGDDLISGWWEGTSEYAEAEGRFVDLLYIKREFEKAVASLATLKNGAIRAADDVPTKPGRPKGTAILSRNYIEGLAAVYRNTTDAIPAAGDGLFAKFVGEVLTALGRYNDNEDKGKRVIGAIKYESVIDAIKDARTWSLTRAAADKWGPSPFDDEWPPLADKAMQDDVGDDLCSSWREVTSEEIETNARSVELLDIEGAFEQMMTSLASLETAAIRDTTSPKPGSGDGPFARFVMEFLIALGRRNIEYRSVIDAIKAARTRSLQSGEPLLQFAMEFRTALGCCNIEYETVIEALKDARTRSLQNSGGRGPSPFDE